MSTIEQLEKEIEKVRKTEIFHTIERFQQMDRIKELKKEISKIKAAELKKNKTTGEALVLLEKSIKNVRRIVELFITAFVPEYLQTIITESLEYANVEFCADDFTVHLLKYFERRPSYEDIQEFIDFSEMMSKIAMIVIPDERSLRKRKRPSTPKSVLLSEELRSEVVEDLMKIVSYSLRISSNLPKETIDEYYSFLIKNKKIVASEKQIKEYVDDMLGTVHVPVSVSKDLKVIRDALCDVCGITGDL